MFFVGLGSFFPHYPWLLSESSVIVSYDVRHALGDGLAVNLRSADCIFR